MANMCSLDFTIKLPDPEKLRKEMDNSFGDFKWSDEDGDWHDMLIDTVETTGETELHVFAEIKWSLRQDEAESLVRLLADTYDAESLTCDYWEEGCGVFGTYEWDGKKLVDKQGDASKWDDESDDDWDWKWGLVMEHPKVEEVATIYSKENAKSSA